MVSVLGNYNYNFPISLKLKLRLKDMIEDEVDEKYYLSDKMVEYIVANNDKWTGNNKQSIINKSIASTINTAEGTRRCDCSNYVCKDLPDNYNLKDTARLIQVGELDIKGNDSIKRIYSSDGLSPTLTSMQGGNRQPKILVKEATKKGYSEAYEGDGVYINRPHQKRGVVQHGMIQTIKCSPDVGVVVKDESLFTETQAKMITPDGNVKRYIDSDIVDEFKEGQIADISFPNGYNKGNRVFDVCPSINRTTTESSFITKTKDKRGNLFQCYKDGKQLTETIQNNEFEKGKPLNLDLYNRATYEYSQTLSDPIHNSQRLFDGLRIRKLTPKECWRLMGVKDSDYEYVAKNQSNSSLYHLAGDSIVTTCLMSIFGELLNINYIEKINQLLNEIKSI